MREKEGSSICDVQVSKNKIKLDTTYLDCFSIPCFCQKKSFQGKKKKIWVWDLISYLIRCISLMFHVLIAGRVVGTQRADGEPRVVLQEDVEWDDTVLVGPVIKTVRGVGGKDLKNSRSSEQHFNCNLRKFGVFIGQPGYSPCPVILPLQTLTSVDTTHRYIEVAYFRTLNEQRDVTKICCL